MLTFDTFNYQTAANPTSTQSSAFTGMCVWKSLHCSADSAPWAAAYCNPSQNCPLLRTVEQCMLMGALGIGLILALFSPSCFSVAFLSQWRSRSEGISLSAAPV